MVEKKASPEESIILVKTYFTNNFKNFILKDDGHYTGYWWLEYINNEDIKICFDGDIGGHFYIKIFIAEKEYALWQYNRSVNQVSQSTKENIHYQLSVLKSFLQESESPLL